MKNNDLASMQSCYKQIKSYVMNSGYENEIEWQEQISFHNISEADFLRETAWVILCTGMKEQVVRKYFRNISLCYLDWESSKKIVEMQEYCIDNARYYFNNIKKLKAIVDAANKVNTVGFQELRSSLLTTPINTLMTFSFIGPITAYHLAKNLGLPFAKADRHLLRLSRALGHADVQGFCNGISLVSGDPIQVVDIVLWRFATLRSDYIDLIRRASEGRGMLLPIEQ